MAFWPSEPESLPESLGKLCWEHTNVSPVHSSGLFHILPTNSSWRPNHHMDNHNNNPTSRYVLYYLLWELLWPKQLDREETFGWWLRDTIYPGREGMVVTVFAAVRTCCSANSHLCRSGKQRIERKWSQARKPQMPDLSVSLSPKGSTVFQNTACSYAPTSKTCEPTGTFHHSNHNTLGQVLLLGEPVPCLSPSPFLGPSQASVWGVNIFSYEYPHCGPAYE